MVLGLAPTAHGANRTGRVFTGDRSGDWLFRAMHRAGLANQPESVSVNDGLALSGAWVAAAVKCAPPGNTPLPEERIVCRPFLERELALLSQLRVVVCLGNFAYQAATEYFGIRPRPKFGHGVEVTHETLTLICSFHPSQQNTFTGKLTEPMIDAVFALGNEDDLVRLVRRVEALQAFLKTDDGANLLTGYRRAANILKKEGVEGDQAWTAPTYTPEPAEADLIAALDAAQRLERHQRVEVEIVPRHRGLVGHGRGDFARLEGIDDHGGYAHGNHLARIAALAPVDRKSTRLNSSHIPLSRMPSSA